MQSNIEIRFANEEDIDRLYAIQCRHQYLSKWTISMIKDSVTSENESVYVLTLKHDIIAFCILGINYDFVEILQFVVDSEWQNMQLGTRLLNRLVTDSIKHCVNSILLEVDCDNTPACMFYKKNDFEVIDIRKNYYSQGRDALVMRKVLNIC